MSDAPGCGEGSKTGRDKPLKKTHNAAEGSQWLENDLNLPLAVVALLPPKREADSGSVGCVGSKGAPQACVKEKINVKLKLRGQLRFSGSSYRTVKKRRNEMLVERERNTMVRKME